ncbi:MAG: glycoside hydrolase family 127 protein [Clostridiales bacterium]|jgi:DUF1680 family protein|nr:glycoside hydrolase family 127 protein [Clostridiales bacterium]
MEAKYGPVPIRDVRITGGFWKSWQETAARSTVPAVYSQFEKTGRFKALAHGWREGEPDKPHIYYDSDVAKWIEGAAYSLHICPDAGVEAKIEALIDLVEAGMSADGYFNSYFQSVEPHMRWTRRADHELYCAGHFMEAAVAYYEATGRRRFLDLMRRSGDHIRAVFAESGSAAFETPGHEEIELALLRMWRCDGDSKWLGLARHFIDRRGKNPADLRFVHFSPLFTQDHAPVAEQASAEGHAVRFAYLFAAATELALATGDEALAEACRRVWRDAVDKKMYVTGGVGSMARGEAFGPAYYLPNFEAYAETCASIAMAFFARRLSLLEPRGEYADVFELQMYNGALAGISLDGKGFFYENPLCARPSDQELIDISRGQVRPARRAEVFDTSCCPPNILRFILSLGGCMYDVRQAPRGTAASAAGPASPIASEGRPLGALGAPGAPNTLDALYVHHYAESVADVALAGQAVRLRQETSYPWNGAIALSVSAQKPFTATIALRAPAWCGSPSLNYASAEKDGYLHVTREWHDGDRILLELPMDVAELEANPLVLQDAGRAALKRGPLVYCAEEADNGPRLHDLLLGSETRYETAWMPNLLGGVNAIKFGALRRKPFDGLYRKWAPEYEPATATAVPYYAWANRGPGEMAVWLMKEARRRAE